MAYDGAHEARRARPKVSGPPSQPVLDELRADRLCGLWLKWCKRRRLRAGRVSVAGRGVIA